VFHLSIFCPDSPRVLFALSFWVFLCILRSCILINIYHCLASLDPKDGNPDARVFLVASSMRRSVGGSSPQDMAVSKSVIPVARLGRGNLRLFVRLDIVRLLMLMLMLMLIFT
jgi:hypothetical protein